MKLCKVNDVTYSYLEKGEGEVLLLLHGFTGSKETWSPFLDSWSKHNRVIAIDLLGHGETSSPSSSKRYKMENIVNDLTCFFNELVIRKAHLLGYSMGGRVAIAFASTYPAKVHSLILESCTPGIEDVNERINRQRDDEKLANFLEETGMESFVDYWGNIPLFVPLQKRLTVEGNKSLRDQRLKNNVIGLANNLRGLGTGKQISYWDKLGNFTFSTLLICGEEDKKFCCIMKRMEECIQLAEFHKISHASHVIHMEQFQNFDTIVSEFLQKGGEKE